MKESINAIGTFSLQVIENATGKLLEEFTEKNLFLKLGQTNIAKLLGGDVAGVPITKIGVGTNGTAPSLDDTALAGMFSKAVTAVTYPDANSVKYEWTISDSEANGLTIVEFGLLTAGNVLCARKVRSAIIKTAAVSLIGSWKLFINS